ncbi:glycerol-3-phosphate acyltransferase mino [Andrena cerasifolii]|uniref:glycerol-3-phosphate acyltransferase mino n=1 Tax=Andrena cerasifolii TaxID=2819439 RepID=UPI004037DD8E
MDGLVEVFLLFGVLFYFFNFRPNNMVDVLSTRLQEVYAKWETRAEVRRNPESTTTRFSVEEIRRTGQQFHRKRVQDREQARKIRENSLYKIKETEPLAPFVKEKTSFLHYCCTSCTPSSRDSLVNTIGRQHMPYGVDMLVIERGSTLLYNPFRCISHIYSRKEYIYPRVTQTVLEDEKLQEAIETTALEEVESESCNPEKASVKARARARMMLLEMESRISNALLKMTAWLLYKVLPYFIQTAVVLPSQIEMLKRANDTGLPLILLPLHRSHLDYIIINLILLMNNVRNPLIAAGDNLKIPFFGWLLRGLGAFFIKRRIDPVAGRKDVLYRATLRAYIMETLRAGHNIEFFIEGGRTRTGKPCMPKSGILSVIVDAYMDGTIEDALLVPVAMNYERLVDGNFVREQLGQPKRMESFWSAIKAMWATLMGNCGIIKVDFCQPFSLREMLTSFQARRDKWTSAQAVPIEKPLKYTISSSSIYGTDVIVEEHRQLVDRIARHVVYDSSASTPIMSTNAVAFLLLNKFRDGCTLSELIEALDSIRRELECRNRDVAFCGSTVDIINHALDILGPGLVMRQGREFGKAIDSQPIGSESVIAIRPVSTVPAVIELSYYSNTMLSCYVMDSIVATALYAELQWRVNDPIAIAENNITISQDLLIQRSLELCDIFSYEFIFCKPCQELKMVVLQAIENLSHTDIITLQEECCLQEELWSKRYAQKFDDSSDEEYYNRNKAESIKYKLSLAPEHAKRAEFLQTLLRPLVDTYSFSAFTLRKLVGQSLTERDLVEEVLSELKTNLDRGIVNYGESLCVDPVKNSLKLFEKWNVLECYPQENVKVFYLKDEYDTDSTVTNIYETIAAFKWTRNIS